MTSTKTRKFVLTNSFHGSKVTVRVPEDRVHEGHDHLDRPVLTLRLTAAQARRAGRSLCGIQECRCGWLSRDHGAQPVNGERDADVEVMVSPSSEA